MFEILLFIIGAVYLGIWSALIRQLWVFWRHMRMLKQSAGRTQTAQDITDRNIYAPDPLRTVIHDFTQLGFQRIGEFEVTNFRDENDRLWIMADEAAGTHAAIVLQPYGVFVSLNTVYEDGAWIQTNSVHPSGVFIDRMDYPKLRRETAATSDPSSLIKAHQELIAAAGDGHGAVRKINSPSDYRERGALWRSDHLPIETELILSAWRKQGTTLMMNLIVITGIMILMILSFLRVIQAGNLLWFALIIGILLLLNIPRVIQRLKARHIRILVR